MNAVVADVVAESGNAARYARCLAASKKAEWEIDKDLMRGRTFDFSHKFLPDGLSLVDRLGFLSGDEARLLSQVQGRTYAYVFGLVERFISAKMLEQSRAKIFGDQLALEGLVRFSNEEIKHQELFRRMEAMMAPHMPAGYRQVADPNDVARAVLAASTWSVLALTCHIELFVQSHYAREHCAARGTVPALPGRVPVSLEGRVPARDIRRVGVESRAPEALGRRARSGGERSHRPRGRRGQPPADASRVGRRLFLSQRRTRASARRR